MESQRVLVTGGHGFIGGEIVNALLERGHDVSSFDRSSGGGDVRDQFAIRRATKGCDVVIHLAGMLGTSELLEGVHDAIDVNVVGATNVLAACRDADARYIGITMPDCWPSIYQATKLAAHRIADAFANAYALPVVHVRTFNVYGPGQAFGPGHPQKILPTFAVAAWREEPLQVWGSGCNTVDLVHVSDVAATFADVVDCPDIDGVVDCGSGVESTVLEVARGVIAVAGSGSTIEHLPMRAGELEGTFLAASDFGLVTPGQAWQIDARFAAAVEWYRTFA